MAPMYKLGAKMPPALPVVYETSVASIFTAHNTSSVCSSRPPFSACPMYSYPTPITSGTNMMRTPIIAPPTAGSSILRVGDSDSVRRRTASSVRQNTSDSTPPTTPSTAYAASSAGCTSWYVGTWNSGSLPRIDRSTITAATEATTVDPMSGAFKSPMSSSSAKMTAATGVLNAAASAPAAPTGTSSRTRCGGRPTHRPMADARPAPICTEGPSRPIECPDPTHSTPIRNFPRGTSRGIMPPWRWNAALVCGTPLPRTSGNTFDSSTPASRLAPAGIRNSRAGVGSRPNSVRPARSIASANNTADRPAMIPTSTVSTRNRWFSRRRRPCSVGVAAARVIPSLRGAAPRARSPRLVHRAVGSAC